MQRQVLKINGAQCPFSGACFKIHTFESGRIHDEHYFPNYTWIVVSPTWYHSAIWPSWRSPAQELCWRKLPLFNVDNWTMANTHNGHSGRIGKMGRIAAQIGPPWMDWTPLGHPLGHPWMDWVPQTNLLSKCPRVAPHHHHHHGDYNEIWDAYICLMETLW